MNKEDLMELVFTKEELRNVDTAIPLEWADKMRKIGVQPFYYAWNYNGKGNQIFGVPVNLAEKFYEKFNKLPETIGNADMDKEKVGAMFATLSLINEALKL